MSFLNTPWIVENFGKKENFTFFEIGSAEIGINSQVAKIKRLLPNGKYYAFEAANHWHESNEIQAIEFGIEYFKYAICDIDGDILFHPSLTQNGEKHLLSSSIFNLDRSPGSNTFGKEYGDPYVVKGIRLETFCKNFNVSPDFIHIDVEGAELKVFQNIGEYKPKCIWTEIGAFKHYDTGTTFEEFNDYLEQLGYYKAHVEDHQNDALYCQVGFDITPYTPCKL